jgi:hypothetical protein
MKLRSGKKVCGRRRRSFIMYQSDIFIRILYEGPYVNFKNKILNMERYQQSLEDKILHMNDIIDTMKLSSLRNKKMIEMLL